MIAAADGGIVSGCTRVQLADPALRGTTWSCTHCSHELDAGSSIAHELDRIKAGACDHPENGKGVGVA
ncbi:MAG TPA: hypothetical protein VFO05_13300 [Candidatus Limnocylindrales bacterium]|nr:hypothetical protein [Candidatus Limnocylindrales bacterium]